MPSRTPVQSAARAASHRWPFVQRVALRLLDVVYGVALLPFRRTRAAGRAAERHEVVAKTVAYNEAAERMTNLDL